MFLQVNSLFRPKGKISISNLLIDNNRTNLLNQAKIDLNTLQKDNNGSFLISSEKDKLDVIGASFTAVYSQNKDLGEERLNRIIENQFEVIVGEMDTNNRANNSLSQFSDTNIASNPIWDVDSYYFTNPLETLKLFRKFNNKKSAGIDEIPNIVLKNLPFVTIYDYSIIFNNCLNNCYFPKDWKTAKVVPIPKKGKNPSDPSSYRPISLLPNISKIFEILIKIPLEKFLTERNIIPDNQFGFRYRLSTVHALNKLTSDVHYALAKKESVAACLIDLQKAFDTVWIKGLAYKLSKKGCPPHLLKIIISMLRNKKFYTTGGMSSSGLIYELTDGMQQGTVTAPTLFNFYNADIPNLFGIAESSDIHTLFFADDLIVYITGTNVSKLQERMQITIDKINDYYLTWKLKINPQKCETILFREKLANKSKAFRRTYKTFNIKINNITIPHQKTVKYLGLNLDERMLLNKHLDIQLDKARKSFLIHSRIFYSKYLNNRIKIICYMLLVRPILTYGCPIWYNVGPHVMEKIRKFERKCIRACTGVYRNERTNYKWFENSKKLYDAAKIPRIDSHIIKLIRDYFANIPKIRNNDLISGAIYPNDEYYKNAILSGHLPPEAFMFLDKTGRIMDKSNIPSIYHLNRKSFDKRITYSQNVDCLNTEVEKVFVMTLPKVDTENRYQLNINKYWWLGG